MEKIFNCILDELYQSRGLDLSGYRQEIIKKRIYARIQRLNTDAKNYLIFLKNNSSEFDFLINSLLINVSFFFRNPLTYEIIAQNILPRIIDKKKRENTRDIRVWSAGCAAGEEAYSIAILIAEALKHEDNNWTPYIFATDISKKALESGIAGIYNSQSLEHTKLGIINKYFFVKQNTYIIKPCIKKMVRFSLDDLTHSTRFAPADSVFGTFDIILCRNVLIYFSIPLQKEVFNKLYMAMDTGGYLILGIADSPDQFTQSKLTTIDSLNKIFCKKEVR